MCELSEALAVVTASPDHRVLKRFDPQTRYDEEPWNLGEPSGARLGVFCDIESTGLDVESDDVIELSLVPFTYDAQRGIVYNVLPALTYLEEPSRPITPEITNITGITPEMVKGYRIDDAAVNELIGRTAIVFAHNADFDRRMGERRIPSFANVPWCCTQRECDWRKFGVSGGALLNIAMTTCGVFTEGAHRATHDCQMGIHVLATAMSEGRTALSYLLESAREPTLRVCAMGAPRDTKDMLKARGYRALYQGGQFQYWYRDMRVADASLEMEWCRREGCAHPVTKTLTARDRYSRRVN